MLLPQRQWGEPLSQVTCRASLKRKSHRQVQHTELVGGKPPHPSTGSSALAGRVCPKPQLLEELEGEQSGVKVSVRSPGAGAAILPDTPGSTPALDASAPGDPTPGPCSSSSRSPGHIVPLGSALSLTAFWQTTHMLSSPKRHFSEGTDAPRSCPKPQTCLGKLSHHKASGPPSDKGSRSASPTPQTLRPSLRNVPRPPMLLSALSQPEPTLTPGNHHPVPRQRPTAPRGSAGGRQTAASGTC